MIEWRGEQVVDEVYERIRANMIRFANSVVQLAERNAPKKTGRLATSIGYNFDDSAFSVMFTVDAPYGMFVEYGTRYMIPHPYIRPALNDAGEQYGFYFGIEFRNVIPTDLKLLAAGPTFQMHKSLTAKQKEHVKKWLKPFSKAHWHSNVSRTKVHVRRHTF